MAKKAKRKCASNEAADKLLEWSEELGMKTLDHRNIKPQHWKKGSHIHAGGQDHIPIKN